MGKDEGDGDCEEEDGEENIAEVKSRAQFAESENDEEEVEESEKDDDGKFAAEVVLFPVRI